MREVIEHKKIESRKTKKEVWKVEEWTTHPPQRKYEPKFLDVFVVNLSSVPLNEDEMALLNKGIEANAQKFQLKIYVLM